MEKKKSSLYNIGGLWIRESKDGEKHYLSGNIMFNGSQYKIFVFENQYKRTKKHPDYNVVLDISNVESKPAKTATLL